MTAIRTREDCSLLTNLLYDFAFNQAKQSCSEARIEKETSQFTSDLLKGFHLSPTTIENYSKPLAELVTTCKALDKLITLDFSGQINDKGQKEILSSFQDLSQQIILESIVERIKNTPIKDNALAFIDRYEQFLVNNQEDSLGVIYSYIPPILKQIVKLQDKLKTTTKNVIEELFKNKTPFALPVNLKRGSLENFLLEIPKLGYEQGCEENPLSKVCSLLGASNDTVTSLKDLSTIKHYQDWLLELKDKLDTKKHLDQRLFNLLVDQSSKAPEIFNYFLESLESIEFIKPKADPRTLKGKIQNSLYKHFGIQNTSANSHFIKSIYRTLDAKGEKLNKLVKQFLNEIYDLNIRLFKTESDEGLNKILARLGGSYLPNLETQTNNTEALTFFRNAGAKIAAKN